MDEPKLSRVVTRPGWRHEWWQYEGHYIVKTYSVDAGGKLHYEDSQRFEGKAPTEAKERKAEPVQAEQPVRKETMKEAILRREEHDSNMRDAGFYGRNGVYIRNPNPSH